MPLTKEWLELEDSMGGRSVLKGTPEEIRAQYDGLIAFLMPLMPAPNDNVQSKDGEVDGVKYRTYTPQGASSALPIAIWIHGGGLMLGDLNADDLLCRAVAEFSQSTVVSVDYHLTPEYKWPTQLEDCLKVYKWAHSNASTFSGDPSRMYTIGGSAGGSLALCVANKVVKDPALKSSIKGIAAIMPGTVHPSYVPEKYKSTLTSMEEHANDAPVIDAESMEIFFKAADSDPKNSDQFALLAEDNHKNFPPTYFVSAEFDPLRDDAYAMEKALQDAGVKTKHDYYPSLPHYFFIYPQIPQSNEFVAKLIAGIEWLKSQM